MAQDRQLGSRTAGVWTAAQALACGLSEGTLARRVAAGVFQRLHRGVYCDGGVEPSPLMLDGRGRIVARVDLGDEQRRFAVEADGRRAHAGEVMRAKDRRRDKVTGRLGWATERVTWSELRTKRAETLRRVVAAAEEHDRHR